MRRRGGLLPDAAPPAPEPQTDVTADPVSKQLSARQSEQPGSAHCGKPLPICFTAARCHGNRCCYRRDDRRHRAAGRERLCVTMTMSTFIVFVYKQQIKQIRSLIKVKQEVVLPCYSSLPVWSHVTSPGTFMVQEVSDRIRTALCQKVLSSWVSGNRIWCCVQILDDPETGSGSRRPETQELDHLGSVSSRVGSGFIFKLICRI